MIILIKSVSKEHQNLYRSFQQLKGTMPLTETIYIRFQPAGRYCRV